jgi:hypothetical protein
MAFSFLLSQQRTSQAESSEFQWFGLEPGLFGGLWLCEDETWDGGDEAGRGTGAGLAGREGETGGGGGAGRTTGAEPGELW